ncbi:MAG: hypothetical protein ACOY3L_03710 [Pseudomonadota bacterium]
MAGIKDYSVTAGSNTALNGISVAEGCPIANWNNAVRQHMADEREQWNHAEWFEYGDGDGMAAIAYASATSFTVAGADVTGAYHAGRRVKAAGATTGTIYGTIASSSFLTSTTVNVAWDSGALQNESLTVWLSILSKNDDALPTSVAKVGSANSFTATQTLSGAALNEAAEIDVASAATTAIGVAASNNVRVTGATTITAFDSVAAGITRRVRFAGALTLTHNATSLILPGGANIITTAGDEAEFTSLGAGNWVCRHYQKADGTAVVGPIPATQAEMEAASDTTTMVTPGRTKYHPGVAKAWCKTAIAGGVPSIARGHNISSITDNGTGDFTYVFTTPFSDANYAYCGSCRDSSGTTRATSVNQSGTAAPTSSACRIVVVIDAGSGAGGPIDNDHSVSFFGDQ